MTRTSTLARLTIAGLTVVTLAGCATPIRVSCAPLRTHFATRVPDMDIIAAIRTDSRVPRSTLFSDAALGEIATKSSLGLAINQQIVKAQKLNLAPTESKDGGAGRSTERDAAPMFLLLSGGGQWGAYGAAFLEALDKSGTNALPHADFITGVSTGGLQALFVGAHQADPVGGWLTWLRKQYSPQQESDIVERGSWFGAVAKGSVAKLAPLRSRIEDALCPGAADLPPDAPLDQNSCPLIAVLARDNAPQVLLGFVEADSGDLMFVSANQIAQGKILVADQAQPNGVRPQLLSMRDRQQCLTGAALASAAVPVQYQQLQIASERPAMGPDRHSVPSMSDAKTYMDGGVRQSVFFALPRALSDYLIGESNKNRPQSPPAAGGDAASPPATAYIVRNGPTTALPNAEADASADAFTAAMRGYALMVNQSEVTSIAALRLIWPDSDMRVTTADAYDQPFTDPEPQVEGSARRNWPGCKATMTDKEGVLLKDPPMFNPQFMACLRAFGRFKARQPQLSPDAPSANVAHSWIVLPGMVRDRGTPP